MGFVFCVGVVSVAGIRCEVAPNSQVEHFFGDLDLHNCRVGHGCFG